MDELIIDEKKYISSKHAAKLTGYAKDYVGQLCREGRVQAQLVGRSWYVLESAILDHRFGADAPQKHTIEEEEVKVPVGWQTPRYEPAHDEPLPVIEKVEPEPEQEVIEEVAINIEQQPAGPVPMPAFDMVIPKMEEVPEEAGISTSEVVVEASDAEEPVPVTGLEEVVAQAEAPVKPIRIRRRRSKRILYTGIRLVSVVAALASIAFTVANSGYFDEKLYSSKRGIDLVGISIYKK